MLFLRHSVDVVVIICIVLQKLDIGEGDGQVLKMYS